MDFDNILFHDENVEKGNFKRGSLVIASPFLKEYYFDHAAVLLLDNPSDGGLLGLVLNKRSKVMLSQLFPDVGNAENVSVYCGGPVGREHLFMLHSLPELLSSSLEVCPGIYVGGNPEEVLEYVADGGEVEGKVRFFLGYSGWSRGQLASEIHRRSWTVDNAPDTSALLSGRGVAFWRRAVEHLGPDYRGWLNVPDNPSMN